MMTIHHVGRACFAFMVLSFAACARPTPPPVAPRDVTAVATPRGEGTSAWKACGSQGVAVQIIGSGGPIAGQEGRTSSAYLVWVDGRARLLVDIGQGATHGFGLAAARLDDLDAILVSHLHVDHAGDLGAFVKSASFHKRQTHVVLAPVAFLRRLVALIPPPRQNTIRYHGGFAPHAKARPGILALVPRLPGCATEEASAVTHPADAAPDAALNNIRAGHPARTTRHSWAQLYKRVFAEDLLVCTRCGGPRRLIAFLSETNPVPLRAILQHLGLPTEAPRTAPARASPQADLWG